MSRFPKIFLTIVLLAGTGCSIFQDLTGAGQPGTEQQASNQSVESGDATLPNELEPEPFAEAVRLATNAAELAQAAQTNEEWGKVGVQWDEAAQFMMKVPEEHEQYAIAQDRIPTYQKNRDEALIRAGLLSP